MGLGIQGSGLIQQRTKSRGTTGPHEFERDGLLQRRIQTDQLALAIGQEALLFCVDSSHTKVCDNEVRVAKNPRLRASSGIQTTRVF
jgi:hypothetical protein